MARSIDNALAVLVHQLPSGWSITELSPGSSHGSRDPDGQYKADGGWYVQTLNGWCVTVEQDGWETERGRWFQWGSGIRAAALTLAWSIRAVRRNPHLVHLCIAGPGEVQRPAYFVRSCAQCVTEARDLFSDRVEWSAA